jgi:hypothetical protein
VINEEYGGKARMKSLPSKMSRLALTHLPKIIGMGIALKPAIKPEFRKKYTQCLDIGAANGKPFQRSGSAVRVLFTPTYLTVPVAD